VDLIAVSFVNYRAEHVPCLRVIEQSGRGEQSKFAAKASPYLALTFLLSSQYFFMRPAILAFAAALILRPCGFGWPFLLAGAIAVKARIAASVLWISFCSVSRCDFSSETMPARFVMPEFYGERQAGVKGGASGLPRLRARPYSFASFRILLPTTKAAALQSSHVTKYPCVI